MNTEEIYEYLDQIGRDGYKLGLNRVQEALKALGNPQKSFKIIHVAGTNGKGSTSTFIYQVLKTHGYKTGLFTSPHIINFYDRIKVDEDISEEDFLRIFDLVREATEKNDIKVSTFEFITLCAVMYFKEKNCDYAIMEVGMGGRLDATNALGDTFVSVIAKIGMDHQEYLGDSLEEIAYEKACIMKDNGRCVVYDQKESVLDVFKRVAKERNNKLVVADFSKAKNIKISAKFNSFDYGNMHIETRLSGAYQIYNAQLALTVLDEIKGELKLTDREIEDGMRDAYIPARFDVINENPTVIYDGGHNIDGVYALINSLKSIYPNQKFVFVFGVMKDKAYEEEVKLVIPLAKAFVTFKPQTDRGLDSHKLKEVLSAYTDDIENFNDVNDAIDYAIKNYPYDVIVVFGTLYSAEQAYEHL